MEDILPIVAPHNDMKERPKVFNSRFSSHNIVGYHSSLAIIKAIPLTYDRCIGIYHSTNYVS